MVEAWTQLSNERATRQATADSIRSIRENWSGNGNQDDELSRFNGTYGDVIEVMKQRYAGPSTGSWSTDRTAFLKDLDGLFAKVKAHEAELAEAEVKIAKEKQRWYRNTLGNSVVGKVAEKSLGSPAYPSGDPDEGTAWSSVSERVHKALAAKDVGIGSVDQLLEKLEGLDEEKKAGVLVDFFLRDPTTGDLAPSLTASAEAIRQQNGTSLEPVMTKLLDARTGAAEAKIQIERHHQALADLKRAQAAHEQDKIAKARNRQRKQAPRVDAEVYDGLPQGASLEDIRACLLCQVLAGLGIGKPHYYLSVEDDREDQDAQQERHVDEAHSCAAGRYCVQITDEDVNMTSDGEGQGDGGPVLCRECVQETGQPTVYCSVRCASNDFTAHREDVHKPARRHADHDVEFDAHDLEFENDDHTRYHVKDVTKFVWKLDEALERFFVERNPDVKILSAA